MRQTRAKPGRPKAGQTVLTRERILSAALQLIDDHGVDAFSMRRLASRLGVDPMAIYHHLPNKDAILAGLVTSVFAGLQVPANEQTSWQDQVRVFARAYRNLARAHPNFVLYLVTNAQLGARAALAANERLFAALAAAGLSAPLIVRAADLVVDYLNGFALAESSGYTIGQPNERQSLLALLAQYPSEHFPIMRRVYNSLAGEELAGSFETGLDMILAGIEAWAKTAGTSHAH